MGGRRGAGGEPTFGHPRRCCGLKLVNLAGGRELALVCRERVAVESVKLYLLLLLNCLLSVMTKVAMACNQQRIHYRQAMPRSPTWRELSVCHFRRSERGAKLQLTGK